MLGFPFWRRGHSLEEIRPLSQGPSPSKWQPVLPSVPSPLQPPSLLSAAGEARAPQRLARAHPLPAGCSVPPSLLFVHGPCFPLQISPSSLCKAVISPFLTPLPSLATVSFVPKPFQRGWGAFSTLTGPPLSGSHFRPIPIFPSHAKIAFFGKVTIDLAKMKIQRSLLSACLSPV